LKILNGLQWFEGDVNIEENHLILSTILWISKFTAKIEIAQCIIPNIDIRKNVIDHIIMEMRENDLNVTKSLIEDNVMIHVLWDRGYGFNQISFENNIFMW
jgi:hypothetical protein